MAGHSKWAQIKHKKAGADQKRGALFSKLARLITVTAREGGTNPDANTRLRQAIDQAKTAGVPKDNIERAIARAVGAPDAENLRAVEYEAYGPGGSAILISGVTDNPNRTTNEVKHILDEYGGRLAAAGSVTWLFDRKIVFEFNRPENDTEALELALIDAGADDTAADDSCVRALVSPERAGVFRRELERRSLSPVRSEVIGIPKNEVALTADVRAAVQSLVEALEAHDDITEVWTNVGE